MIVCLIAEGSYPYVTGGVSGWVHDLIKGLPEIDFKVLSIMPSKNEELKYQYSPPNNLIEIKTIYLDDYLNLKHRMIKRNVRLNSRQRSSLQKLLMFDDECDWEEIIKLISSRRKVGTSVDFLQSIFFWNTVLEIYNEEYANENFNTFFWTFRTMFLPFIHLFHQKSMEADIYHSVSTGYAGIVGVYLHVINKKPMVLTEHGIYAREREEEILKAKWVNGIYKKLWIDFFYYISKAAYKESDRIVALFERNRDIQLELGAPKDRTIIIPNGVDLSMYDITRQRHRGYIVGAILRIVPIKDVMTLIRAFKIVKETIETAKLFLIGPVDEDPEYYDNCRELTRLLNLENHIVFTGRADVGEYLKIIDVIVLTSISEGQPLVILEAMASGIPIVATDVGSCRELLARDEYEEDCGFITNLVSPNETASQIIKLLRDEKLREEMGRNGQKRVKRMYSREKFLNSYKSLYRELE